MIEIANLSKERINNMYKKDIISLDIKLAYKNMKPELDKHKEVVDKIIANNPQSVVDYKAGKDRALGFLVGQAMKETKGKANPQMLNKMFLEILSK